MKRERIAGVTVTVQTCNHRDYTHTVVLHAHGKRKVRYCRSIGQAKTLAQCWSVETANHGSKAAIGITDSEKRAILDFHHATKEWQNPPSVADALKRFLTDHSKQGIGSTVSEAVDKQLESLRLDSRELTKVHQDNCRLRLKRFNADFGDRRLRSITKDELKHWFHNLGLGAVSQRNFKLVINPLFVDALAAGELDRNPLAGLKLTKDRNAKPPAVFSPSDVAKIMATAPDGIRAALAVQFFGGIRRAEVGRLKWDSVNFLENSIKISEGIAKTASRRNVTMTPNLKAWLLPLAKVTGLVAPSRDIYANHLKEHRESIGIKWKANGARHSFITYLMAVKEDANYVANQAGNSPNVIHRHYKALRSKREAEQYFAIVPDHGEKVLQMPSKTG